jgi:hypothetical protein
MKKKQTWLDRFQVKLWEWKMRIIHPSLYKKWKYVKEVMDVSYVRWLANAKKRQALKLEMYNNLDGVIKCEMTNVK